MDLREFVLSHHTSTRARCPDCSDQRKKKSIKTLSITIKPDQALYYCHHCGLSGSYKIKKFYEDYMNAPQKVTKIPTQLNSNVDLIKEFFAGRGVVLDDINKLPTMTTGLKRFGGEEKMAVGFVYGSREEPQAIKWRSIDGKSFTCDGAPQSFYGMENVDQDDEDLIIVEGECDVIALYSLDPPIRAVSAPNGAPMKVSNSLVSPEEDKKFAFVWNERQHIETAKRVVLATDADEAGEALAEEIARRVGRAKCWRVKFPEGTKDANDAVNKLGGPETRRIFDKAEPLPLDGVYGASSYLDSVKELYKEGHGRGASTGFDSVDELFTIAEGQLSIVTGLPSSGKSEFIDQLMMNLAQKESWKFAVCSFENPPSMHIAKMCERFTGRPFYKGPSERMSESDLEEAIDFINDHFVFLESQDGGMSTIDSIIERTKQAVMRLGIRGLIIDPYNFIEHASHESEHASINQMLTRITAFAKSHRIHVWVVAHPQKIHPREDGSYPVPKGMSISGSAAWFAKADLGITVNRLDDCVEIHCWKSRFKWVGQQGVVTLGYNMLNGRYEEQLRPVALPSASSARGRDWMDWDDL